MRPARDLHKVFAKVDVGDRTRINQIAADITRENGKSWNQSDVINHALKTTYPAYYGEVER